MMAITFKSNHNYFLKEKLGLKNNTIRKIDPYDSRFHLLRKIKLQESPKIKIVSAENSKNYFIRKIIDVSYFTSLEDFVIITWEQDVKTKSKGGEMREEENERIVGILKHGSGKDLNPAIRRKYNISEEDRYKKCVCEYDNKPRKIVYKKSLGRFLDLATSLGGNE